MNFCSVCGQGMGLAENHKCPGRPADRIPRIIEGLRALWMAYPDQRLGQLISNLQGPGIQDVFFKEDHDWEGRIKDVLQNGWTH